MQLSGVATRVVPYGLVTASLAASAQITFNVNGFAHAGLAASTLQFGNNGADIRVSGDNFSNSSGGCTANLASSYFAPMFLVSSTATKFKNATAGALVNLHIGGIYFT